MKILTGHIDYPSLNWSGMGGEGEREKRRERAIKKIPCLGIKYWHLYKWYFFAKGIIYVDP